MKNHLLFITCLILLSSCTGPELELVDWIDRAEEACECENLTGDDCTYLDLTVVVKEGKIDFILPTWTRYLSPEHSIETDDWMLGNGPCSKSFHCMEDYLEGRKVEEKSGEYEVEAVTIRPKK